MAQGTGTLGSKLYMSDASVAENIDSEAEFFAQAYTEIGLITNMGEFGRVFTPITYQTVAEGRTRKLKAGFDDGSIQLVVAQDLSDDGQELLYTAANESNQDHYAFRVELNDNTEGVGGPTTYLFRGLPMSFRSQLGALQVINATATIEVNSDILHVFPSDLYDRFITGGSLTHYELFSGSDTEAVDPVIAANALSLVSGDDSAGTFAVNGSQAIGDTGYTLSAGSLVVETRVKISAITNAYAYFGVTDQKVALEAPIESASSADTITTNATDAVGFFFDTRMDTDNIWLAGVNNDVDETHQDSTLAFVADTYRVLRIEIASNGDAVFYINGNVVGTTMTTSVATGVALYPTLAVSETALASRTMTVDYLYVRQDT
jgi:hypothetical protein